MTAKVVHRVNVHCDKMTGIGPCRANRDFPASTEAEARKQAARSGWSHHDDRDFCPVHTK